MIVKLKFLALIACFVLPATGLALSADLETQLLKDFVKTYNSSKSFRDLAKKTSFHNGYSTDSMLDVMGAGYMSTLPKLSFDLGKKRMTFTTVDGKRTKLADVEFVNIEEGELKINGRAFTINQRVSGLENANEIAKMFAANKTSHLYFEKMKILSAFVQESHAQTVIDTFARREYESAKIGKLRSTTALGFLDKGVGAGTAGYFTGTLGAAIIGAPTTMAAAMASGFAAIGLLAALPGHYLVKKAHAALAPSCADQAVELAQALRESKMMLSGLSCENTFGDPSITFASKEKSIHTLFANWERQDAYFDSNELFDFDRKGLVEVRRVERLTQVYDKTKGEKGDYVGEVVSYKSGDAFDQHKKKIEPYRRVLEIMGKYESCYKCQDDFHRLLVREVDRYEVRSPEFKIDTYPELQAKAGSKGSSNGTPVKQ